MRSSDFAAPFPIRLRKWAGAGLRKLAAIIPSMVLLFAASRSMGQTQLLQMIGAAVLLFFAVIGGCFLSGFASPAHWGTLGLYPAALCCLWITQAVGQDWYSHFAQALLLVVPVSLISFDALAISDPALLRRACRVSQALRCKTCWPGDFSSIRALPEVRELSTTVASFPVVTLGMLSHPDREVRWSALAALEGQTTWSSEQEEFLLRFVKETDDEVARAAAAPLLAGSNRRPTIESIADLACHSDAGVRRAVLAALLSRPDTNWPWIRDAVRQSLSNAEFRSDGPLLIPADMPDKELLADLNSWASDQGYLALRAALTLGSYYSRALADGGSPELAAELKSSVVHPAGPPALRMEIARVLRDVGQCLPSLSRELLDPANPAPLRLMACEALLEAGEKEEVLPVLHELARIPNRDLALTTAAVVQAHLQIDLGMPLGTPFPGAKSQQAAEVARRLLRWAGREPDPKGAVSGPHRARTRKRYVPDSSN